MWLPGNRYLARKGSGNSWKLEDNGLRRNGRGHLPVSKRGGMTNENLYRSIHTSPLADSVSAIELTGGL